MRGDGVAVGDISKLRDDAWGSGDTAGGDEVGARWDAVVLNLLALLVQKYKC